MIYLDEVVPRSRWYWLYGHTKVRHPLYYASGTASVTPNSTSVTLSVAPTSSVGDSGSFAGWNFSIQGKNEVYIISAHTALSTSITLTTAYNDGLDATASFKIWKSDLSLPTDLRETIEITHDHVSQPLEGKGIQELRKIASASPKAESRPYYYCTYDYNSDTDAESTRYRMLKVFPAVSQYTTILNIDYIKEAVALDVAGDEPLMPIEDRIVLFYGALSILWSSIHRNPEEAARNKALFDDKLARMLGKIQDSMDKPRIAPESIYVRAKRGPRMAGLGRGGLSSLGGGQSTYSTPNYLENVTINGATITGTVTASAGITIDGRDVGVDGASLDAHIAASADVHGIGATSNVVGTAAVQTLTNKTIDADLNTISNIENADIKAGAAIDAAKIADGSVSNAEFQYVGGVTSDIQTQLNTGASNLTTHMSDTTTHGTTGDVVGTSDTQTLTNKTINGSTNTLSNIASTSTTLSTETSISIGTSNTATTIGIGSGIGVNTINIGGANTTVNITGTINNQNVTNLNVTDKLITINDGGAASSGAVAGIEVEEDAVATAYIKTSADRNSWEIKAANTAGVATLTPGSSADTIVLAAATQTLTNKTVDVLSLDGQASTPANPSSGFYKAYVKDSTQKLTILDSAGVETTVGAGGGSKNYIAANDGATTTGWSTYVDAAGSLPVNGTGGSANITFTTSASSPLSGTSSFLITKDASNRQGEGVSYDIALDVSDRGKVLAFSMNYAIASGTYADDDVIIYFYDVTNSALLEPVPYKLKNHSLSSERFFNEIQIPVSCASLRLIFHISSTSATAYTLKIDDLLFGPQAKLYGSVATDFLSYTSTISNISTTDSKFLYKRVADSINIRGWFRASGAATGAIGFTIPSGLSIDTTKFTYSDYDGTTNSYGSVGFAAFNDVSVDRGYVGTVIRSGTSTTTLNLNGDGEAQWGAGNTANGVTIASGDGFMVEATVPIVGWSSSQILSQEADTRVISATAYRSSSQALTAVATKIAYNAVSNDSHGAFDTTNNRYEIKSAGYYEFAPMFSFSTSTTSGIADCFLYKNGSPVSNQQQYIPINSATLSGGNCSFKDSAIAGDYYEIFVTPQYAVTVNSSSFLIKKLSGPAQIAASEDIDARASGDPASATVGNPVIFPTSDWDTHAAYSTSTGLYTCPASGKYEVSGYIVSANATISLNIAKSGTTDVIGGITDSNGEGFFRGICRCLSGQTLSLEPSGTLDAGTGSYIYFKRIGNY